VQNLLLFADVNLQTALGHTPLWLACNCGDFDIARLLLKNGADVTTTDTDGGLTPLHFLARFDPDRIGMVAKLLVEAGADVDAISQTGETPLLYVLDPERNFRANSGPVAVRSLLRLGASPLGQLDIIDFESSTLPDCPLSRALSSFDPEVLIPICEGIQEWVRDASVAKGVRKLLLSNRRKSQDAGFGQSLLTALFAKAYTTTLAKPAWCRVLSLASAYHRDLNMSLSWLLTPAVQRCLIEMTGKSALRWSFRHRQYDIANTILDQNLFDKEEFEDPQLLLEAVATRDVELVKRLYTLGISFSQANDEGKNFLHQVAACGWEVKDLESVIDAMTLDVDIRSLVQHLDFEYKTPFDICVLTGRFQLADYLARFGVRIDDEHGSKENAEVEQSLTLLGRCLVLHDDEVLILRQTRYLLKHKPRFVVSSTSGSTALTLCWTQGTGQIKRCKV
jgi:ankyrin repeat protein